MQSSRPAAQDLNWSRLFWVRIVPIGTTNPIFGSSPVDAYLAQHIADIVRTHGARGDPFTLTRLGEQGQGLDTGLVPKLTRRQANQFSQSFSSSLIKGTLRFPSAVGLLVQATQAFPFEGTNHLTHSLAATVQIGCDLVRRLASRAAQQDLAATHGECG
jgi:hypothetical protein